MRRTIVFLKLHPYAIDPRVLEAQRKAETQHHRTSFKQLAQTSCRQAMERTKSLYGFFFPEGYRGGPAR